MLLPDAAQLDPSLTPANVYLGLLISPRIGISLEEFALSKSLSASILIRMTAIQQPYALRPIIPMDILADVGMDMLIKVRIR